MAGDVEAQLTGREREVWALLAGGWSNAAIAVRMGCSGRTVETHVAHLFDKLWIPTDPAINRRVVATRLRLTRPAPLRGSTEDSTGVRS